MEIVKKSAIGFEEWKALTAGRVFRNLLFSSRGGFSIGESGKFCIFPEHKNFDEGNLTICPPEGPVVTKMNVVIDDAKRSIVKIDTAGVSDGFTIRLHTSDRIHVYG